MPKKFKLEQMLVEAEAYPQLLRIAVRLHLDGVTSDMFHELRSAGSLPVSDPASLHVMNLLRDIERAPNFGLDRHQIRGVKTRSLRELALEL